MDKKERASPPRKAFDGGIRLNGRDYGVLGLKTIGMSILFAWVFYNSPIGMVILPFMAIYNLRNAKEKKLNDTNGKFDLEFKEMLLALADALQSGYSIENAFKDAEESLRLMYGERCFILKDMHELNSKINMRIPAEKAFDEFAAKHPTEEALGFAGVFSFARRLGGEYVKNLRRTIEKMEDKLELKQDIRAGIAEKQMEFKIMCVMPVGILSYVKLTSRDFLDALYGNVAGIVVMTGCIGLYVLAIFIGNRIVNIKV